MSAWSCVALSCVASCLSGSFLLFDSVLLCLFSAILLCYAMSCSVVFLSDRFGLALLHFLLLCAVVCCGVRWDSILFVLIYCVQFSSIALEG
jgi:hypothetical protein